MRTILTCGYSRSTVITHNFTRYSIEYANSFCCASIRVVQVCSIRTGTIVCVIADVQPETDRRKKWRIKLRVIQCINYQLRRLTFNIVAEYTTDTKQKKQISAYMICSILYDNSPGTSYQHRLLKLSVLKFGHGYIIKSLWNYHSMLQTNHRGGYRMEKWWHRLIDHLYFRNHWQSTDICRHHMQTYKT